MFLSKKLKHSQIGYKMRPRNRISKNFIEIFDDVNSDNFCVKDECIIFMIEYLRMYQ